MTFTNNLNILAPMHSTQLRSTNARVPRAYNDLKTAMSACV